MIRSRYFIARRQAQSFQRDDPRILIGVLSLLFAMTSVRVSAEPSITPEEALRVMVAAYFDSSHSVEILSDENFFHSGHGIISQVCYVGDVWLLKQRNVASRVWQTGALLVRDNVAYYAELGGTPHLAGRACVSCHANGPMTLHGASSNPKLLAEFNLAISASSAIDAYIPDNEPLPKSDALDVNACVRCHDGVKRSKLFGFQAPSIYHQTWSGHMPPERVLTDSDRLQVMDWIRTHP